MNDSKTPTGTPDANTSTLLEKEKAADLQRVAQQEAFKKAQDLKDKNQFTEAFASKGAARGNF